MYDYSNLLGAMRQRGITQKSLAKSVGKSEATINRKLCGAREFTQSEMFKILEIIGEPVERVSFYFFTHRLVKTQVIANRRKELKKKKERWEYENLCRNNYITLYRHVRRLYQIQDKHAGAVVLFDDKKHRSNR